MQRPPLKIYSFLPSATEMVYALGLGDQLCGVTHECDYPPAARSKPVVIESVMDASKMDQAQIDEQVVASMTHGQGLYKINKALLAENKPDVIVTQELCDVCSVSLRDVLSTVSELSKECQVISLKPQGLQEVLGDIVTVGRACHAEDKAKELVTSLEERVGNVRTRASGLRHPRVFCVEWYDPIFASGHWVPEMAEIAGGHDLLGRTGEDSRKVPWEDVLSYDPEVLILMPCGFGLERAIEDLPLLTRREGWASMSAVKGGRVYATNGSAFFSRPGPRLVDGLEIMAKIIHPEVFGSDFAPGSAQMLDPPRLSRALLT